MLPFRREDGVAEHFHTSQNRELLEKLADQTGRPLLQTRPTPPGWPTRSTYSEAGITSRETRDLWDMPFLFLLALSIRAAEWLLRRSWVWYENLRAAAGGPLWPRPPPLFT